MNSTMAPAGRHVHVDFDVDREHLFHYRSQGGDGHRVALHRGDSITFTCNEEFSIHFDGPTPFEELALYSHHSFITAHVRPDALPGEYGYTVEVVKDDELVADPDTRQGTANRPAIVIET